MFDKKAVRKALKEFDFGTLFREHLGWDNYQTRLEISVGDKIYSLTAIAQKRGFIAYTCPQIPDRSIRRKIDHQITKSTREHFVVYCNKDQGQQVWQWVRRETGKPIASRDHRFDIQTAGDSLIQRLNQIAVGVNEEEGITLIDIAGRARSAFDVERITKRFYDRFKSEHSAFLKLVKGIEATTDLEWYTSLMLNRLMFVYFIQKKGFLDGDTNYLQNRMRKVRESKGKDKFQSFYRYFLVRLFHDGLGKVETDRKLNRDLEKLLGKVPYLNGGFFEVHQLEERNADIDIPDKAFEKLFAFFDEFSWHLDERPLRAGNEINPDVVGYIFEKYINQKQMGAYYTKEDITEYISKNTIIPFLFDAAHKKCPIAFKVDSFLWRLLSENPDRYIYAAVRHGVLDDQGNVIPLPKEIEAGVKNVVKRGDWNKAATEPFALPTETWREYVARRQRCLTLREKLRNGEVQEINELVTLNLDIWQFARDAIVDCEGPELLRAFWQAIQQVTVLDPTCGSGAFLFAALRILETLYSDCLERMERFVEDLQNDGHHGEKFKDFKAVLLQIAQHPSERYFILKSIIINNLFGVDIMEEAVEICKLRLFLKLVAQVEEVEQIEPLPDIDFNIRSGNTLVGYTSLEEIRKAQAGTLGFGADEIRIIEKDALAVEKCFAQFRAQQSEHGGKVTVKDKQELRRRLAKLDKQLDAYLAGEYRINVQKEKELEAWKTSHQPFHWFVEFYGIMQNGGFDVVIGNPPYISSSKVRKSYAVSGFRTDRCTDIYAWCLERVSFLTHDRAYTGMIVPLSLTFSGDFASLRSLLYSAYRTNWFSSYGRIPAALFAHDVRVRNTIHIGAKQGNGSQYTTRLHRWFDVERPHLLSVLSYSPFDPTKWAGRVPKLNTKAIITAFEDAYSRGKKLDQSLVSRTTKYILHFKKTAYNWLNFCRDLPPCYDQNYKPISHTQFDSLSVLTPEIRDAVFLTLNGKIQFSYWIATGDDFHVTRWMFGDLPIDLSLLDKADFEGLKTLADELDSAMKNAVSFKLNAGKRVGNYNLARCREVTDKSDQILSNAFGLAAVWDDIELLYTQFMRTDFNDSGEDSDE
jgi:hypothetical protein